MVAPSAQPAMQAYASASAGSRGARKGKSLLMGRDKKGARRARLLGGRAPSLRENKRGQEEGVLHSMNSVRVFSKCFHSMFSFYAAIVFRYNSALALYTDAASSLVNVFWLGVTRRHGDDFFLLLGVLQFRTTHFGMDERTHSHTCDSCMPQKLSSLQKTVVRSVSAPRFTSPAPRGSA